MFLCNELLYFLVVFIKPILVVTFGIAQAPFLLLQGCNFQHIPLRTRMVNAELFSGTISMCFRFRFDVVLESLNKKMMIGPAIIRSPHGLRSEASCSVSVSDNDVVNHVPVF